MIRSKWRLFLTVVLMVFLGGLGVSGAAALWSQSGVVKATVTTGKWIDYTRPGFSMPLEVSVEKHSPIQFPLTRRLLQVSWKNNATFDPESVIYRIEAVEIPDQLKLRSWLPTRPTRATNVSFQTTMPVKPFAEKESIKIVITPYVYGVEGTPTSKIVWVDHDGRTWIEGSGP